MNLNAITLAITRPGGVRSWDPLSLFTAGVNGAWYDPSDFSTLFQDAAGTTPVTAVEQPVGLMLDKSKGLVLGPELVTNGDFSQGTTGWTQAANSTLTTEASFVGRTNVAKTVNNSTTGVSNSQTVSGLIAGKTYKITAFAYAPSSNTQVNAAAIFTTELLSNRRNVTVEDAWQEISIIFTAAGSTTTLSFNAVAPGNLVSSGDVAYFDNISVRELPGNHAFNSSGNSANFPVLSARYNLLTKTEQFDDAVWNKSSGYTTVTANAATAPDGTVTADKLIANATNNAHLTYQSFNYGTGSYRLSLYAKAAEYSKFRVQGNSSTTGAFADFDLSNGTYGGLTLQGSGWTNIAASILNVGNGWYLCSITFDSSVSVAGQYYASMLDNSGNSVFTGDGTSGIYIWGADLRVSNDALNQPTYQRVNTATDYDTVGFKPYLKFNGTNQWLQTNSIDFSYGDKMFVCAGVRKLSDAGQQVVMESSAGFGGANPGSFTMQAPYSALPGYAFNSRGTITSSGANAASGFVAPLTSILSGIGNISGDQVILRVNGTQAASSATDQGTGNYVNYPLYIGARAGTSLYFNGRLYQMVVAGKQASAAEITSTETYINQKTGAF